MSDGDARARTFEAQRLLRVGAALLEVAPAVGPAIAETVFHGKAEHCFSFLQLAAFLPEHPRPIPWTLARSLDREIVSSGAGGEHGRGLPTSPTALIEVTGDWSLAQEHEILHGTVGDADFRADWATVTMKIAVRLLGDAAEVSNVGGGFAEVRRMLGAAADQPDERSHDDGPSPILAIAQERCVQLGWRAAYVTGSRHSPKSQSCPSAHGVRRYAPQSMRSSGSSQRTPETQMRPLAQPSAVAGSQSAMQAASVGAGR